MAATAAAPPKPISSFRIGVECGGGTYIRSLVRDIGIELGTVATMTSLERTKQGLFLPEHCIPYELPKTDDDDVAASVVANDDEKSHVGGGNGNGNGVEEGKRNMKRRDCNWTVETITAAIRSCRKRLSKLSKDEIE